MNIRRSLIIGKAKFPEYSGIKCDMMPFIQGDQDSLPEEYKHYSEMISNTYIEKGRVGYLTIHESYVESGTSQRGYNSVGANRNVHIEVGRNYGLNTWGGGWRGEFNTFINGNTEVIIANSVSDTCRYWDEIEMRYTHDGDLSSYLNDYPETSGHILNSGDIAKISIFTPHECINQNYSGYRQFFRIVGDGVTGREDYFTLNPLMP